MPHHKAPSTRRPIEIQAPSEVELWTLPQVAEALKLSRTKLYELIWQEHLPIHKFGRAVRVSPGELQRWLEGRALAG
jgi:excisionase family DNA binding protein